MMRRLLIALTVVMAALVGGAVLAAVEPDEILTDPAMETRARGITRQLRCLVCQNQSIDDSNAPLAKDLRRLVRERLKAGDNDDAALAYVVARYGDFVLLRPPVKSTTWLLWFGPAVLLVAGAAFLVVRTRRRTGIAPAAPAPLDDAEARRVAALLGKPGKAP